MIIFPFGFYILEGRSPVYVGNDLEAQSIVRTWMEANPEKVCLGLEAIGTIRVLTQFLGWDQSLRPSSMDLVPWLFETVLEGDPEIDARRLYGDYQAALDGHAELVGIATRRLRERH
jgi:hypothetical protein